MVGFLAARGYKFTDQLSPMTVDEDDPVSLSEISFSWTRKDCKDWELTVTFLVIKKTTGLGRFESKLPIFAWSLISNPEICYMSWHHVHPSPTLCLAQGPTADSRQRRTTRAA